MSDVLISASSLKRCGWARVLGKKRKPSARAQVAMDKGTLFHGVVEELVKTGRLRCSGNDEVDGWVDALLQQWRPAPGALVEIALGLGPGGVYVPVTEILPHHYVPDPVRGIVPLDVETVDHDMLSGPCKCGATHEHRPTILTGGRADFVRVELKGTSVEVGDWKTGAYEPEDPNTNLQLNALGMAAAMRFGTLTYRTWLYMAQDARFVHGDPVVVNGGTWKERLDDVTAAATVGEEPRPGRNCFNCWERRGCQFVVEDAA